LVRAFNPLVKSQVEDIKLQNILKLEQKLSKVSVNNSQLNTPQKNQNDENNPIMRRPAPEQTQSTIFEEAETQDFNTPKKPSSNSLASDIRRYAASKVDNN
jgi:hypothetical protein